MITLDDFNVLVQLLGEQAREDIEWAEALTVPQDPDDFAEEVIFVICNSGMKNTIARVIYEKCMSSLSTGGSAHQVFGHRGKAGAIDLVWKTRESLFNRFIEAGDRLAFLESLPWIGPITKYHAAKNFGLDVAKPDVHLQRLADREGCTVQQLCERLAAEVGLRVATVDTVLWRACADGVLNSRTGEIIGRNISGTVDSCNQSA
jgi:hypothetical protein